MAVSGLTVANIPLPPYDVAVEVLAGLKYQYVIPTDSMGVPVVSSGTIVTTATESSATVTNSSGVKVAANASRIGGFLQNLSTTEVLFYSWSGTATTSDFKLGPYQVLPFRIDGCLYRGAISMIADDAGPYNIKIVECV